MDDEARRTWTGVFLTLGGTMLAGGVLRWFLWYRDHLDGAGYPEVLWVLGTTGVAFVLAAVSLGWPRSTSLPTTRKNEDWTLP